MIKRLFLPFEAKVIQGIPLSFVRNKDSVFWPRNHDGNYSVKSGYKLLLEEEVADLLSASNPSPMKDVWKGIWKLKVPPHIRNLLWCAGSDSLPTRVNLAKRKILTNTLCPLCSQEPKDTVHALWSCPLLTEVWRSQFEALQVTSKSCRNFLDILLLAQQDHSCFELFAMMASLLWMRRNKVRASEESLPLSKINTMASESLKEFQNLRPTHAIIPRTARSVRWRPPPNGSVKVNFDGALFSEENTAGLGIIIRDDHRLVMAAFSQQIPLLTSVEMVEVLAARRALLFAKELGFESLVVEGNVEGIIHAINGDSMLNSEYGHILQDIKLLSSSVRNVSFNHIRRQGNFVAHRLARRAICNHFLVWMEDVPHDILDVYNFDLNLVN